MKIWSLMFLVLSGMQPKGSRIARCTRGHGDSRGLSIFTVVENCYTCGANIMLNKPSVQSSPFGMYVSSNANDGNKTGEPSVAASHGSLYWQGDLQGFYMVDSVSVTSHRWYSYLTNATIGVSVHDFNCSDGDVTICGQWSGSDQLEQTQIFNCTTAGPVRFVRIWRDIAFGYLILSEVEVEGEPRTVTGTVYDKFVMNKVVMPTTSLSVVSVIDCGTSCHRNQPCLTFSYSAYQQPNCLLAANVTMTTDNNWVSYSVEECFKMPDCS